MTGEHFSCKTVESIKGNVQKMIIMWQKTDKLDEQVQFFNRINFQKHVLYVCKFKY